MTAFFSQTRGVVNQALISLGVISSGSDMLTNPGAYYSLATWTTIWKSTGWWSIIFLASIAGIAPSLVEAAEIDGAGRLQRIWHITLPGIRSTISWC
jgi:putative aldouronate transport system permease protein